MRQIKNKAIIIKKKDKPRREDQIRRATQVKPKPNRPVKHGHKSDSITPRPHKKPRNKKHSKGLYTLGMELANVLTPKQWIALFLLLNISSSYALQVNNQISQPTAKDDNESIEDPINEEEDCEERSLPTFNKPDIRLGAKEGKLIPISCLESDDVTCSTDQKLMESFKVDVPKMNAVYTKIEKENTEWQAAITPSLRKISNSIMLEEVKDVFHSWIRNVAVFKNAYHSVQLAHAAGGGTCDNHKDVALLKIFNQALKFGLEVKVQVIIVYTKENQTSFRTNIGKKHFLQGHTCLLIGSDVEDVIIKNDRAAVAEYLANIKSGRIHDTWNKNCRNVNDDKSGFYHEAAYWDDLYIQSVSLDFEKLKILPISAQRLFCRELSSVGLPVELNQGCGLFTQHEQRDHIQVESLQAQQIFVS